VVSVLASEFSDSTSVVSPLASPLTSGVLSTEMLPPCLVMMSSAYERPMPDPLTAEIWFALSSCQNLSNTFLRFFFSIPTPLSLTLMLTVASSLSTEMEISSS
jgi:hypothetical protein